jgi:hypothetical protein
MPGRGEIDAFDPFRKWALLKKPTATAQAGRSLANHPGFGGGQFELENGRRAAGASGVPHAHLHVAHCPSP